jgi:hypothetical protein
MAQAAALPEPRTHALTHTQMHGSKVSYVRYVWCLKCGKQPSDVELRSSQNCVLGKESMQPVIV